MLFLPAGTFHYWQAWVFLAVFALSTVIPSVYLMRTNPAAVERRIGPLGHKVYAIVNYRDCRIEPAVQASYRRMVEALEERCYLGVTRYGLSDILEPDARRGGPGRPSPLDARVAAGWDDTERSLLALS